MNAYFDQERGNQWGELFLKTANDSGLKIKNLLSVDYKQITSLASKMKHTMIAHGKWLAPEVGFAPIADGNFLPSDPMKNFQDSLAPKSLARYLTLASRADLHTPITL